MVPNNVVRIQFESQAMKLDLRRKFMLKFLYQYSSQALKAITNNVLVKQFKIWETM